MVKHNNMIVNNHFRKDWDKRVRTWFNQPARKQRRRDARKAKAKAVFPRPVTGALRPVVHCPTNRYNLKVRLGRGFSLEELRAAGINPKEAQSIGIAVDYRRANKSSESINLNAQRLKFYKANLVVYPRKPKSKVSQRKDVQKLPAATQRTEPVGFKTQRKVDRPAVITAEMKAVSGHRTFRQEHLKARKLSFAAAKAHAEATGRR